MSETIYRQGFDSKEWEVHKFGGTSVADASCFCKVATIVEEQLGIFSETTDPRLGFKSSNLYYDEQRKLNLGVVVSAIGGKPKVTDLLLNAVKAAAERDDAQVDANLDLIIQKHHKCIDELQLDPIDMLNKGEESFSQRLKRIIESDINDIKDILRTVSLLKWHASRISELVSGYGETWSAQILCALLNKRAYSRSNSTQPIEKNGTARNHYNHNFIYLDARRVITIDEDIGVSDGVICWDISVKNLQRVYEQEMNMLKQKQGDLSENGMSHFVITGYIASNTHGVATTLQRDGSDYSASIMGKLLQASSVTIWTDVDGVLSADPRRVPGSYVLPEISYTEAMELAYFGAKVIHPKTMQPAILANPQIPIFIRNTFNSSFRGSRIYTTSTTHTDREQSVCGFSSIEKMALINVEGSGLIGVKGVARRLFGTLESIGVNVVLISQASSEHSITFALPMNQADQAKAVIEEEFHKEIKQNHISKVDVQAPCSIIAAVGDGMHFTTGVSGRFFSAFGDAKINILAISQGSSERNISAVVLESESTRALRAVHAAFRLSQSVVRVGIVGMNEIGESLLQLLESERNKLKRTFDIDLQVCALVCEASSKDIIVVKDSQNKVDSITWSTYSLLTGGSMLLGAPASSALNGDASGVEAVQCLPGGVSSILDRVFSEDNPHSVIFDCSADETIGTKHVEWLKRGVHVVTANNTALSGSSELRQKIKEIEKQKKAKYLREVTVGGGLPIISTIRDLLASGDNIRRVDGILSVSLSYIFHRMAPPTELATCSHFDELMTLGVYRGDLSMSPRNKMGERCSFSEAVKEAIALGLMEEDPTKDMNNEYTARCLMVLAKELGLDESQDVLSIQSRSESLIPDGVTNFYEVVGNLDKKMQVRVSEAASCGCVPRHVSSIDVKTGIISVKIIDVPYNHVFATTPPSCGCVRFFTQRHQRYPLLVQGPCAGADSTASALLAELLNLMQGKVGVRSGAITKKSSNYVS